MTTSQVPTVSQVLGSFYSHLESLSADRSCQYLKNIFNENSSLRERNRSLQTTYDQIRHTCHELETEVVKQRQQCQLKSDALVELQRVKDAEVARLEKGKVVAEKTLKAQEERLKESSASITDMQNKLKQRGADVDKLKDDLRAEEARSAGLRETEGKLRQANNDLKLASHELGRLHGFTAVLTDLNKEDIALRLGTIYMKAYGLANRYFNTTLDTTVFKDPNNWKLIREAAEHPVPASNSPVAKQMRTATVLALLGRQLAKIVFQPTYLLPHSGEDPLSGVMGRLAETDSERESHLRSVLLGVAEAREHRKLGAERAQEVVNNVSVAVRNILPSIETTRFVPDLQKVCQDAMDQWMVIQRLSRRVHAEIGQVEGVDAEEWDIYPGNIDSPASSDGTTSTPAPAVMDKGPANGKATVSTGGGQKQQISPENKVVNATTDATRIQDAAEFAHRVWPCFVTLLGDEGSQLLTNGVCLTQNQVSAARAEDQTSHPVRKSVKRSRAQSISTNASGGESFLSGGKGGGQKKTDV